MHVVGNRHSRSRPPNTGSNGYRCSPAVTSRMTVGPTRAMRYDGRLDAKATIPNATSTPTSTCTTRSPGSQKGTGVKNQRSRFQMR